MQLIDKPDFETAGTQILHPGSRTLFRYWERLRAERPCPTRDELDLRKIVTVVPDLMVLEKNMVKSDWQYRLAGTRICEFHAGELTSREALAGWPRFERQTIEQCWHITQQRLQPSLVRMRFISNLGNTIAAELIALPIYTTDKQDVQILGGFFPFMSQNRNAVDHLERRELVSARMIWTEHEPGEILPDQTGPKGGAHLRLIQGGLR